MTAQVEFFCTADEERDVLRYLTKPAGTKVFDGRKGRMVPWKSFSPDDLPPWPKRLDVYLWQPPHGCLIWHTSRPSAVGPTHASLVKNVFAGDDWDKLGLGDGDKMLDADLSPILIYRRGRFSNGQISQNSVLAPPSNLERVGPEYERWVNRCLAHIRRRGKIIHDYRAPSTTIANPYSIANTIYAFPGVMREIDSQPHKFVVSLLPDD